MRRAIRRQIDLYVSTLLIYQEAKSTYPDKAMEIIDKEVDRRVKEIVTDRYQGVYARYEAHLKSIDLTRERRENPHQAQIMVSQYMRDHYKPMLREPPRRELLKYYQDHLDDFTTPERAELLLIEIPDEAALGKPPEPGDGRGDRHGPPEALGQLKRAAWRSWTAASSSRPSLTPTARASRPARAALGRDQPRLAARPLGQGRGNAVHPVR